MKSRSWIIILAAVLIALFWILWPRSSDRPFVTDQTANDAGNQKAAGINGPQAIQPNRGASHAQNDMQKRKDEPGAFEKAVEERNRPIDFYGQTVDQDGNPLPGVKIKIIVPYLTLDGRSIPIDRISDSSGLFDVHDVTGDGIDVEHISKEGYTLEPMMRSFGPVDGAPGNPVVFKLWLNDIKEPLITGQRSFDVRADGSPCLLSVTSNGFIQSDAPREDFSLRLNIPQPQDGAHPNWSFEFEAANGGIAEELNPSAAMYRAPEGGYTNLFRFVLGDAHPWTRSSSQFNFYFYLADRKVYGRISFELMFFRNKPPYIRTEYAINPTGSRILR